MQLKRERGRGRGEAEGGVGARLREGKGGRVGDKGEDGNERPRMEIGEQGMQVRQRSAATPRVKQSNVASLRVRQSKRWRSRPFRYFGYRGRVLG